MFNGDSHHKKLAYSFTFALILILVSFFLAGSGGMQFAYAKEQSEDEVFKELEDNVSDVLDDIDSDGLDEFLTNDFNLEFFDGASFKDLVSKTLSGELFSDYSLLTNSLVSAFKDNFKSVFSFFFSLFILVLIFVLFNNFCSNKYNELKSVVKIIFSLIVILMISVLLKDMVKIISDTVQSIFKFTKILFPILLSLILLSGANGTYAVYNSLSVFLLNTGSYLFVYILLPISISIMTLSLVGCIFNSKRFSKVIDIFKLIFKYLIIGFIGIFGIFSAINMISSGMKDGVSYKLTKFAIRSYVPVLGGYLSEGFDFVHTCSVLVKNSFGICGILVLLFMILKPLLLYVINLVMFKLLSCAVLFIGDDYFSEVFENTSKSISYFVTVLVGIFMCLFVFIYLLILSVSVVG